MARKYKVADQWLENNNVEGGATYNVAFTYLGLESTEPDDQDEIIEITSTIADEVKAHLQLSYNDLEDAPGIPEEGFINEEVQDFHKVAFTGNYEDLDNTPISLQVPEDVNGTSPAYEDVTIDGGETIRQLKPLNEIAFTGIAGGGNSGIGGSQVFDLTEYSINEADQEDPESFTSKLHNLGNETIVIKGLSEQFKTDINRFFDNFLQNKTPSFIVSNSGNYFVLNIEKQFGVADNIRYYKVDVVLTNSSSYTHQFVGIDNLTDEQFDALISSILIDNSVVCFVVDLDHQALYCKVDDINTEIELPELAEVATSGSYYDLDIKPNLDVSDSNTDISGLAGVAMSGNYDDLINTPQPIVLIDLTDTVLSFSQDRCYNILNRAYSDQDNEMTIENLLQNIVLSQYQNTALGYQFLQRIIYLLTDIGAIRVNNMSFSSDAIIFNLSSVVSTNYLTIDKNNKTDNEILSDITCSIIKIILIIDPLNHKLYIKRQEI